MATNTHTEHPGGGKPQFPPFNKETFASQLVWFAIFFIVLYVVIGRLAIPRIGGIIESRRARIEGDLAEANRLKVQSDRALRAYEKSLADAHARARVLVSETRDKLNAEADQARRKLEAELSARLTKAEEIIAATKTSAMDKVRDIAIDAAMAIVERLIGATPAVPAVEAAVTDALKR